MRRAGVKLPLVFTMSANPVVAGFVDSYARPGGNATGMSLFDLEPFGKRMDLLLELRPGIRSVAVMGDPGHPGEHLERKVAEAVAAKAGLRTLYFPVRSDEELERAFAAIASANVDAIAALADALHEQFGRPGSRPSRGASAFPPSRAGRSSPSGAM